MREIKFRGKDTVGMWWYGSLITKKAVSDEKTRIRYIIQGISNDNYCSGIVPETIGQFTGVCDKNSNEIFEGDIISVNGSFHKIVKYIDNRISFCLANICDLPHEKWMDIWQQPSPGWWNDSNREIEVIGNIHDNPELINE